MVRGKLTIIVGGVRSGKSAFAERQLVQSAQRHSGRLVYIASGKATDPEMQARIEKHRQDRSTAEWLTLEQPTQLENVLPFIQAGDLILWDCVTTWLANEFYDGWETGEPCIQQTDCIEIKVNGLYKTIDMILSIAAHLAIVSNEVLDERPSAYAETQLYSKWLGAIHCKLVDLADCAIEMDAGIAVYQKGKGPF